MTIEPDTITRLWTALAHGDDDHREWLREAIEAFFTDQPIPAPYGSGNKERLIHDLQDEIITLRKEIMLLTER
jgi:hypothetical protein